MTGTRSCHATARGFRAAGERLTAPTGSTDARQPVEALTSIRGDNRGMSSTDLPTEAPRATSNRSTTPGSEQFKDYIGSNWAERTDVVPPVREHAQFAAERRSRLSALHIGQRLIIPAGSAKVRSNDTDYPFRAHSGFAHLTGWGSDSEPGAVLVMEPGADGHDATVYFRERAGRDSEEFYANPEIGEFWIGARPSLAQVAGDLGLPTRGIAELQDVLSATDVNTLIVRDADRSLTEQVDSARLVASDSEVVEFDD